MKSMREKEFEMFESCEKELKRQQQLPKSQQPEYYVAKEDDFASNSILERQLKLKTKELEDQTQKLGKM